jgi:TPR repeat protein
LKSLPSTGFLDDYKGALKREMLGDEGEEGTLRMADGSVISIAKLERLAKEQDHPQALKLLAEFLFARGDSGQALEYHQTLADYHGDVSSMVFLSKFYSEQGNSELASKYLKQAATLGHRTSLLHLAHEFQAKFPIQDSTERRTSKSLNSFKEVPSEEEEEHWEMLKDGLDLTREAVQFGDGPSHLYLGQVYQEGLFGMEKDSIRALELFTGGSTPESLLRAARLHFDGSPDGLVQKDPGKGLQLLIQSARQYGNPQLKPVADMVVSESGVFSPLMFCHRNS